MTQSGAVISGMINTVGTDNNVNRYLIYIFIYRVLLPEPSSNRKKDYRTLINRVCESESFWLVLRKHNPYSYFCFYKTVFKLRMVTEYYEVQIYQDRKWKAVVSACFSGLIITHQT